MSSTVVQSSDFNTSNITFSQVKVLPGSGAKQAYLNYGGRSLTMQTASMSVPYGMTVFDKQGPKKYSVDLSFRGYEDESPKNKIRAFYNAMSELDEFMVQEGMKNSRAWFKEDYTDNEKIVRAFYTPIVRISKDANGKPKTYPPTIKVALKKRTGSDDFDVQAFDDKKMPYEGVPLEDILVKGAQLTTIIQCTGVWFAGSKFGLSWKAVQIRVDKLPEAIRGFAFADEGQEESYKPTSQKVSQSHYNEDNQVDDEDDFDDAPAPAPAPAVSKKSVLSAVVTPAPAPASMDDEAEDAEPIPVPKKVVTTTKKVVASVKKTGK